MKYYSKNPNEFSDYIEKQKAKGKETIRMGHRLLIGNIILVAVFFVAIIGILFLLKVAPNKKSSHEFELRGWKVSLSCGSEVCHASFLQQRVTSAPPNYVVWQREKDGALSSSAKLTLDEPSSMPSAAENESTNTKDQNTKTWTSHFVLTSPLETNEKVFIKIFYNLLQDPAQTEEFSFRVFP